MTYSPEGPNSGGAGSPGYGSGGYGSPQASQGSTPQGSTPQSAPQGQHGGPDYGQSPYNQPQQSYGAPGQQYSPNPYAQNPYSQPGQSPQSSQPGQSGQFNPVLASAKPSPLPRILTLVVVVLGVLNLFAGLAGQYSAFDIANNFFLPGNGDPTSIALLLASGLVAATGLLPKQPNTLGIAAALALSGWLVLVFQAFNIDTNSGIGSSIGLGGGAITVLVLGFVQTVAAVAATLFASGVVKAPAPKPVSYGQQNPFQGYGQQAPGQTGQTGQNPQAQSYGYGQAQPSYGASGQGGYVPPTYAGPSGNQNTTGSLGYPVGTPKPESSQPGSSGLTGPAGQNSPYSQYQYGQPPVGASGQGPSQHSAPSHGSAESQADRDEEPGVEQTPPYSAPTQAFGTTPDPGDQK